MKINEINKAKGIKTDKPCKKDQKSLQKSQINLQVIYSIQETGLNLKINIDQ